MRPEMREMASKPLAFLGRRSKILRRAHLEEVAEDPSRQDHPHLGSESSLRLRHASELRGNQIWIR